jgi:hypothetical protein
MTGRILAAAVFCSLRRWRRRNTVVDKWPRSKTGSEFDQTYVHDKQ